MAFMIFALMIALPCVSEAAVFRDCYISGECGISAVIGRNTEIYITAENTLQTTSPQQLELTWISTAGGNIFFEESGSSVLDITLLPQEKKIYKAIFSPSNTGEHQLWLTTEGNQPNVIEVIVTPSPEFSEMGHLLPALFIILSALIYSVIAKN